MMKANEHMEKVYELLEQFDFNDLPEQDKEFVLTFISEKEYNTMRATIRDTIVLFDNPAEPQPEEEMSRTFVHKSKDKKVFIKLMQYPVQFYKVAAALVILFGIWAAYEYSLSAPKNDLLAFQDTVYVAKTDTVFTRRVDTITLTKYKTIYTARKDVVENPEKLISTTGSEFDCSREICPNDLDEIQKMTINNNSKNDTSLKDFIVSVMK